MNRLDVPLHTDPCAGGNYRGSGAQIWAENTSVQYSCDAMVTCQPTASRCTQECWRPVLMFIIN